MTGQHFYEEIGEPRLVDFENVKVIGKEIE